MQAKKKKIVISSGYCTGIFITGLSWAAADPFGVSVISSLEESTKGCSLQTYWRANKTKFYSANAIKSQYAASAAEFWFNRVSDAKWHWGMSRSDHQWSTWGGGDIAGSGPVQYSYHAPIPQGLL